MADLDIGIIVRDEGNSAKVVEAIVAQLQALRTVAASFPGQAGTTGMASAIAADATALRSGLAVELELVTASIEKRRAAEEAGDRARLAAKEKIAERTRAIEAAAPTAPPVVPPAAAAFTAAVQAATVPTTALGPVQGPAIPPGFLASAIGAADALKTITIAGQQFEVTQTQLSAALAAVKNDLTKLAPELARITQAEEAASASVGGAAAATQAESAEVNTLVGRFQALGKTIDATSESAIAGYRAEGEALRANLKDLGAKATAIAQVNAAIATVERRGGAAEVLGPTVARPKTANANLDPAAASAAALATQINVAIGEFDQLGRTIDITNAEAVAGFRQQGAALAANLTTLGATNRDLKSILTTIAVVERSAGAARIAPDPAPLEETGKKLVLFGNAADASFQKVPRGARTAANALSQITTAAVTTGGSISGVANAAGSLAFGLSQLSSRANFVAGAAGIGALVSVLGLVIELLERGTEETRKQDAAFKAFNETDASFAARSKAIGQVVSELSRIPGNNAVEVQLVGITAASDEARASLAKTRKELRETVNLPSVGEALASGVGDPRVGEKIVVADELRTLRKAFADTKITAEQFTARLREMEHAHPDFAIEIAQTAALAANYLADAEALRKLTAAGLQARAELVDTKRRLGLTPEITKDFLDINAQLAAMATGGPLALRRVADEQKAVDKATAAWKVFTSTKEGDAFADLTFASARDQKNQRALELLAEARDVVAKERTVSGAPALADLARQETQKAAQAEIARTQGDAAARRKIADDEFTNAKDRLALSVGLAGDRTRALQGLERQHAEAIRKINKDEADKLLALETHLTDERLAAEAKLSDDTFGQQRAAADRQLDADLKSIRDLHLQRADADREEANARRAHTAALAAIEHERADKITEITIAAQQRVDELTGRSGETNPAKIRQGYQKQLDVLAATIASADTSAAEKAAATLGQDTIERLIPLEVAQARMAQLEKILGAADATATTGVTQASALLQAHAISEREAREKIVVALTRQRDVVAATIPLLQAQANNLPGDTEAQAKVDTYRTKLLELNLTIAQTSDQFFKLKEAARDSAQSAIAGFLEGATKLGTQDHTEINALSGQLRNAQDELNGLLSIAADRRTPEENQRITALRGEVEQTTVSLQNAKSAITTWRDLFVDAVKSIADALTKVVADDVAKRLVDATAGLFGGHGGTEQAAATTAAAAALSGAGAIVAGGAEAVDAASIALDAAGGTLFGAAVALKEAAIALTAAGATDGGGDGSDGIVGKLLGTAISVASVFAADGGYVQGPGTATSDSIPARLSAGEFVMRAAAVRRFGPDFFHGLNAAGMLPPIAQPTRVSRYAFAGGGLVESPGAGRFAQAAGGGTTRLVIEHSPDVVIRELQSTDGQRAIVSVVQKNPNVVRAAIGR